ncbi:solute carrier family 10 (sodium/bile acid cotransporter), member 7 [Candidatus Magnetomoraceae bacterium gMMP-15]
MNILKKHWFLIGLTLVTIIILVDYTNITAKMGCWAKAHHGADIVIFFIFLFSGLMLETSQIKEGLTDIQGTVIALFIIFIIAPLTGWLFAAAPLPVGIKIGIFLVAVVPTTLSSGVVMTGSAGGNIAHALLITILANCFAVITVPITLSMLMNTGGDAIIIDKGRMMFKIGFLVFLPLFSGLILRVQARPLLNWLPFKLSIVNQCLIWILVWMALSGSKETIVSSSLIQILYVIVFVVFYHAVLLLAAGLAVILFKIPAGRRESVIFMGGQKTLTLAILLQVTLFSQYGLALAVCVIHHFVHLMIDGYLIGRLRS